MKTLFVTSEFADFAKSGGLGDVSAALPRALRKAGVDCRVLMPGYQRVVDGLRDLRVVGTMPRRDALEPCLIGEGRTQDDLIVYAVLAPSLFQRDGGIYNDAQGHDWPDNDIRFARLCAAAADVVQGVGALGWKPDLAHCHDWPTGLTPAYLRWRGDPTPCVVTIHNLAHQGVFPRERAGPLGVPADAFAPEGVEFYGKLSFMKAALFYADHVTTVSPNYAREITEPTHGAGLNGLLAQIARNGKLSGIVNGVGPEWNPAEDGFIGQPFDANHTSAKDWIKERVSTSLCLDVVQGPLFGVVSRLVHQKGLDLVAETAGEIVRRGGQIAILGVGDTGTEEMLRRVVRAHPSHVAMLNGYNEPMAHRIMAASDFYLMPSRFEPCGLSQMHAQLYGSLPIVHATGGLVDTVKDGETGFLFSPFDAASFMKAIDRAFAVYRAPDELAQMRKAAMSKRIDFGAAAGEYIKLYSQLTGKPVLRVAGHTADPARLGGPPSSMQIASMMNFL